MNATLSPSAFSLFRTFILNECGIDIPEEKSYLVETRLSNLLADSRLSGFEELYGEITRRRDPVIIEKMVDAITTNETLWFRDKTPWQILQNLYLPRFVDELRSGKRKNVRIWSAASSTGQEIYSTAMCVDAWLRQNGITDIGLDRFEFLATDISQSVLQIARNGAYGAIPIMRGLDPYYKAQYFTREGCTWKLDERIRKSVQFQHFNLQNSFYFLGKFDVVFCRYVMIYFSDPLREEIARKLLDCLNRDSVLFLGASELYTSIDRQFSRKHDSGGSYYIGRETSE